MLMNEEQQGKEIAKLQQWGDAIASKIDLGRMVMGQVYVLTGPKIEEHSAYSFSGKQVQLLRSTKVVESDKEEQPVAKTLRPYLTSINSLKDCFKRKHVVVPGIVLSVKPTASGKMLRGVLCMYDAGSLLNVKVFTEA